MLLPILLGFFTAFLALAFALLHLLASLSELRKGKDTLGNQLLLIVIGVPTFWNLSQYKGLTSIKRQGAHRAPCLL